MNDGLISACIGGHIDTAKLMIKNSIKYGLRTELDLNFSLYWAHFLPRPKLCMFLNYFGATCSKSEWDITFLDRRIKCCVNLTHLIMRRMMIKYHLFLLLKSTFPGYLIHCVVAPFVSHEQVHE